MVTGSELAGLGPAMDTLAPGRRTEAAARQFEALLVAHLLKTMREAAADDPDPDHPSGGETYLEMAEQQLAQALADRGGLGLARMILRGLESPAPMGAGETYGNGRVDR